MNKSGSVSFRALAELLLSLLANGSRWCLAYLRPPSLLLLYWPVSCDLLHALNTLLGETANLLTEEIGRCVLLEELH